MTELTLLEKMKINVLNTYSKRLGKPVDLDNIKMNCKRELDQQIERVLSNLSLAAQLFDDAIKHNDQLAKKSALLDIRAHSMSLSSIFDDIVEDTEKLVLLENWQDFPEDYQLPEHFNYPIK